MEELTLAVPDMWADHHVLAVRELLKQDGGVAGIVASARDNSVLVTFDPAQTNAAAIADALDKSGYPVGERDDEVAPPTNKPAWASAGMRMTRTDPTDLIMSGDHRKY